jgi:hypothetical protein
MRLSVTSAKNNPDALRRIQTALQSLTGVDRIEANPVIGSILIYYDPTKYIDFPRLLADFAAREDLFQLEITQVPRNGGGGRSFTEQALDVAGKEMNRAVQGATWNGISLKELIPFGIAASAIFFVDRAAAAAQWLNWIQFAWSAYFELHQNDPVREVHREVGALRADIAGLRELLEQNRQVKPQE